MAPKVCFLGAVRRRTMICCRNVKISASSAARDRNRSTTGQTMSLKRSLITEQHRPILGQPPVNRFATGTMGTEGARGPFGPLIMITEIAPTTDQQKKPGGGVPHSFSLVA